METLTHAMEDELIEVTMNMKVGTAPRPDGFPAKFFRRLLDLLSDKMLKLFNESLLEGTFSPYAEGSPNLSYSSTRKRCHIMFQLEASFTY